jgi:hypothetical protein
MIRSLPPEGCRCLQLQHASAEQVQLLLIITTHFGFFGFFFLRAFALSHFSFRRVAVSLSHTLHFASRAAGGWQWQWHLQALQETVPSSEYRHIRIRIRYTHSHRRGTGGEGSSSCSCSCLLRRGGGGGGAFSSFVLRSRIPSSFGLVFLRPSVSYSFVLRSRTPSSFGLVLLRPSVSYSFVLRSRIPSSFGLVFLRPSVSYSALLPALRPLPLAHALALCVTLWTLRAASQAHTGRRLRPLPLHMPAEAPGYLQ